MSRRVYCYRIVHKDQENPAEPSGFAESWWLAPDPPWYGQPEAFAERGPFHPCIDAWEDDSQFEIYQLDLEDDADEVLAENAKVGGDALGLVREKFEIRIHPDNPNELKIGKTDAETAGDRSMNTVLVKAKKKAAAILPD